MRGRLLDLAPLTAQARLPARRLRRRRLGGRIQARRLAGLIRHRRAQALLLAPQLGECRLGGARRALGAGERRFCLGRGRDRLLRAAAAAAAAPPALAAAVALLLRL